MSEFLTKKYVKSFRKDGITLSKINSKDLQIEDAFIQKINAILEEYMHDEDFGIVHLRRKAGMSRSPFFRKMKALTNMAPSDYIRNYRLQISKYLLEHTDSNVAEAAYDVGFKDPSYFSKIFQQTFGVPPRSLK